MIKQRILHLCKKSMMSRQRLIEGLITQTHFSNILAGRYALAKDLAEAIAKRLDTTPDYILEADNWSNETANNINNLTEIAFSESMDETLISTLPLHANELALEIAANITAVCILIRKGDNEKIESIQDNYLDFYLDVFNDENIESFHPLLQRMLYLYKALHYMGENKCQTALIYWDKILEMSESDADVWVSTQFYRISAFTYLEMFDMALEVSDLLLLRIRKENCLQHLVHLYILRGCLFEKMLLKQLAIVEFAKAEESMIYHDDPLIRGRYWFIIMHNRIVASIGLHMFDLTEHTIKMMHQHLSQGNYISDEEVQYRLCSYKIMLFTEQKNWVALAEELDKIQSAHKFKDSDFLSFYSKGVMLYEQGKQNEAIEVLLIAEGRINKNTTSPQSIAHLYVMLAEIFEVERKYKQSTMYYKKAYETVK